MLGDSHCVLFCPATDVCSPEKKHFCGNNFVSPRLISDEPPNPPGLYEDRTNTTVAYFLSQAVRIIVFPLFHWKDIFLIITFFKCIGGNDPKKNTSLDWRQESYCLTMCFLAGCTFWTVNSGRFRLCYLCMCFWAREESWGQEASGGEKSSPGGQTKEEEKERRDCPAHRREILWAQERTQRLG